MLHAARLAGVEVMSLVAEPVAAAIAAGLHLQDGAHRNVLVFDFGAGSLDLTMLHVNRNQANANNIADIITV